MLVQNYKLKWFTWCFGSAAQLVGAGAQEVSTSDVSQRPTTSRRRDGNLKLGAHFFVAAVASDVAESVDGQVFVQMGPEADGVAIAGRLQRPDLLLLEGSAVRVDLEAESLSGQVFELGVDETDGPAASLSTELGAVAIDAAIAVAVDAVHSASKGRER